MWLTYRGSITEAICVVHAWLAKCAHSLPFSEAGGAEVSRGPSLARFHGMAGKGTTCYHKTRLIDQQSPDFACG